MPPAHSHGAILLCHELRGIITQLHEGKLPRGGALCHKLTPTPRGRHCCENWPSILPHGSLYLKTGVQLLNMSACSTLSAVTCWGLNGPHASYVIHKSLHASFLSASLHRCCADSTQECFECPHACAGGLHTSNPFAASWSTRFQCSVLPGQQASVQWSYSIGF